MRYEIKNYRGLSSLLRQRGIRLKKKWGQNFLFDQNLLSIIAGEAALNKGDVVLEVGPGVGMLSEHLAQQAGQVFAVEIDPTLAELCAENMDDFDNFEILCADILDSKSVLHKAASDRLHEILQRSGCTSLKVVSNLPYSVATSVIINLAESDLPITSMVLLIQHELAERLSAEPGSKKYGSASVILQSLADVLYIRKLSRSVFFPQPKVDSAIIKINLAKKLTGKISNWSFFSGIVKIIFNQRRKKISNALHSSSQIILDKKTIEDVLLEVGFSDNVRAEEISVDQYVSLSESLLIKTGGLK